MAKNKYHRRSGAFMNRSDIPLAKRMALNRRADIVSNREHSAKITLFCMSVSMHDLYGIGYKRLVRFASAFKKINDEFYEDIEVGMAHAKQRMDQIGMPISGELYKLELPCRSKREQEVTDHSVHAIQVTLVCGTIAMNEELGFGKEKLTKIHEYAGGLAARYAKEGEGFLLDEMKKIGFIIEGNKALCCVDKNDNPVTAKRAIEEGYLDACRKGKVR